MGRRQTPVSTLLSPDVEASAAVALSYGLLFRLSVQGAAIRLPGLLRPGLLSSTL